MNVLVTAMLAVLAAASNVTAQDTLLLRTFRTIDVCSSERRWLIAPYLGNIRSTDSLASFDITIGFDTSVVRPTDILTENTLSFMLQFPPELNLVVPGELRAAGFNVVRNIVGDKPLFAVAGNFIGECGDSVLFSFPWPPTFNEEFKKKITVLTSDNVAVVALPIADKQLGVTFDEDTVLINGKDSSESFTTRIKRGTNNVTRAQLTLWLNDTAEVKIDSVRMEGLTVESMSVTAGRVVADVTFSGEQLPSAEVQLRSVTERTYSTATLYGKLVSNDSCACVRSELSDTINIVLTNPIVSVSSPIDDNNDRLDVTSTSATCHCYHGQTNEINVFTIAGERVGTQIANGASLNRMSLDYLPTGPYIIMGTCGTKNFVKLNLK